MPGCSGLHVGASSTEGSLPQFASITPRVYPVGLLTTYFMLCLLMLCRDVSVITRNWEDLRRGNTTFAAVRRTTSTGAGGSGSTAAAAAQGGQPQQQQQRRRRRLVRAGEAAGQVRAAGGGGDTTAGAGHAFDVVDLLSSPSPFPGSRRAVGGSPVAPTAEEELAWQAMEAALGKTPSRQQQQRQRQSGSGSRCMCCSEWEGSVAWPHSAQGVCCS